MAGHSQRKTKLEEKKIHIKIEHEAQNKTMVTGAVFPWP